MAGDLNLKDNSLTVHSSDKVALVLFGTSTVDIGQALGTIRMRQATQFSNTAGDDVDLNTAVLKGMRTFTSTPALADMDVGEIAQGRISNENYLFFKADATTIVSIKEDGTFATITT